MFGFSIYDDSLLVIFFGAVALVLGAVLGSFLNCAAYRIAHKESFVKGRSHCPDCGHKLSALDLVPVFSWLFLKGRCRYCRKKISVRYPLTEIFFGLLLLACLLRFDLSVLCLRNAVLLCTLFVLTLVDLEIYEIPDGCHIIAIIAWLAAAFAMGMGLVDMGLSLISGLVYFGVLMGTSLVMDKVLGRESMGGGDIKLFGVMGLYLGFAGTLFAVFFACMVGLLMYFIKRDEEGHIPFGPAIAAAFAFMLFAGEPIVSWYLGLFA